VGAYKQTSIFRSRNSCSIVSNDCFAIWSLHGSQTAVRHRHNLTDYVFIQIDLGISTGPGSSINRPPLLFQLLIQFVALIIDGYGSYIGCLAFVLISDGRIIRD